LPGPKTVAQSGGSPTPLQVSVVVDVVDDDVPVLLVVEDEVVLDDVIVLVV
jgi:hypothetical protein